MTTEHEPTTRKLPGLFMAAISVGIVFHCLALGVMVLSASTGPWSVRYLNVPSHSLGAPFATSINQYTTPNYLEPLGLANNYHFESNVTDLPSIYLEVLPSAKGQPEKYPDARANMWVRHRQRLLVNGLRGDFPYQPRQGEGITAAGQAQPKISFFCQVHEAVILKLTTMKGKDYTDEKSFLAKMARTLSADEFDRYKDVVWNVVKGEQGAGPYEVTDKLLQAVKSQDDNKMFYLYQEHEHMMPKSQFMRPANSSLLLMQSFSRYLERLRGEPVELVRTYRQPIGPGMLFPSPEAPGKLMYDTPMYPLETFYHSFGNGQPRSWSTTK